MSVASKPVRQAPHSSSGSRGAFFVTQDATTPARGPQKAHRYIASSAATVTAGRELVYRDRRTQQNPRVR